MTYQELGIFIKTERRKLKLTQGELAQLTEVSERTIRTIEKGERTQDNNLEKVLKILGYKPILNISIFLEKINK